MKIAPALQAKSKHPILAGNLRDTGFADVRTRDSEEPREPNRFRSRTNTMCHIVCDPLIEGDMGKAMRIERELMRGAGPAAVLQLLERRPMYGYELVEALSHSTDGVLAMGQSTLYPLLYNLEAKNLVRAEWRESESGRQRKYYTLTRKGVARLKTDRKQWRNLVGAMRDLGLLGRRSTEE